MILKVNMDDDLYEQLEVVAKKRGNKNVSTIISENAASLLKIDNKSTQIVLESADIDKISVAFGGKIIKTADDVTKLFVDNFKISVDGTHIALDPEDAHALKEHFESTGYKDFGKYISDSVNEALSLYLWGSTRGILAF